MSTANIKSNELQPTQEQSSVYGTVQVDEQTRFLTAGIAQDSSNSEMEGTSAILPTSGGDLTHSNNNNNSSHLAYNGSVGGGTSAPYIPPHERMMRLNEHHMNGSGEQVANGHGSEGNPPLDGDFLANRSADGYKPPQEKQAAYMEETVRPKHVGAIPPPPPPPKPMPTSPILDTQVRTSSFRVRQDSSNSKKDGVRSRIQYFEEQHSIRRTSSLQVNQDRARRMQSQPSALLASDQPCEAINEVEATESMQQSQPIDDEEDVVGDDGGTYENFVEEEQNLAAYQPDEQDNDFSKEEVTSSSACVERDVEQEGAVIVQQGTVIAVYHDTENIDMNNKPQEEVKKQQLEVAQVEALEEPEAHESAPSQERYFQQEVAITQGVAAKVISATANIDNLPQKLEEELDLKEDVGVNAIPIPIPEQLSDEPQCKVNGVNMNTTYTLPSKSSQEVNSRKHFSEAISNNSSTASSGPRNSAPQNSSSQYYQQQNSYSTPRQNVSMQHSETNSPKFGPIPGPMYRPEMVPPVPPPNPPPHIPHQIPMQPGVPQHITRVMGPMVAPVGFPGTAMQAGQQGGPPPYGMYFPHQQPQYTFMMPQNQVQLQHQQQQGAPMAVTQYAIAQHPAMPPHMQGVRVRAGVHAPPNPFGIRPPTAPHPHARPVIRHSVMPPQDPSDSLPQPVPSPRMQSPSFVNPDNHGFVQFLPAQVPHPHPQHHMHPHYSYPAFMQDPTGGQAGGIPPPQPRGDMDSMHTGVTSIAVPPPPQPPPGNRQSPFHDGPPQQQRGGQDIDAGSEGSEQRGFGRMDSIRRGGGRGRGGMGEMRPPFVRGGRGGRGGREINRYPSAPPTSLDGKQFSPAFPSHRGPSPIHQQNLFPTRMGSYPNTAPPYYAPPPNQQHSPIPRTPRDPKEAQFFSMGPRMPHGGSDYPPMIVNTGPTRPFALNQQNRPPFEQHPYLGLAGSGGPGDHNMPPHHMMMPPQPFVGVGGQQGGVLGSGGNMLMQQQQQAQQQHHRQHQPPMQHPMNMASNYSSVQQPNDQAAVVAAAKQGKQEE